MQKSNILKSIVYMCKMEKKKEQGFITKNLWSCKKTLSVRLIWNEGEVGEEMHALCLVPTAQLSGVSVRIWDGQI